MPAEDHALPPTPKTDVASIEKAVERVTQASPETKSRIRIDQKLLMSEVQLLLAEKRTAFALLRTGVTVSLVPLSIWTVLVATSRLYNPFQVLWMLVPILTIAGILFLLGIYLIVHALSHLRHVEETMAVLKSSDTLLESLLYREHEALHHKPWRHLRRHPSSGDS